MSQVGVDADFADDNECGTPVRTLFNQNAHLSYYPPGVTGPLDLQTDFMKSANNPTYFICTTTPLNSSVTFARGSLSIDVTPDYFATLHGGYQFVLDSSANLIVYNNSGDSTVVPYASGYTVPVCGPYCLLAFESDGNLVKYYNGTVLSASGTEGVGVSLECINQSPWMQIYNSVGQVIWDAVQGLLAVPTYPATPSTFTTVQPLSASSTSSASSPSATTSTIAALSTLTLATT